MKYNIDQVFGTPLICTVIKDDTSELLKHNHTNEFIASSNQLLENPKWYNTWEFNIRSLENYPDTRDVLLKAFTTVAHDSFGLDHTFGMSTSWFTITRKGERVNKHRHRNSFWTGVYYYDEEYEERNGAALELHHPLPYYGDYFLKPSRGNKLNFLNYFIRPEPKLLVLFPSYVEHAVTEYLGDYPRHSIAFNIVPTSEYGQGDSMNNFSWHNNGTT